jgi:sec-independent protein translocase protein TatA
MQLALILGIIVLLFGTKKLTNVGGDVGAAIRNFRSEMKKGQGEAEEPHHDDKEKIIEGEATKATADATKSTSNEFKFKKKDDVK